ncbi:hypothetical protein J4G37_41440 [Microvirga sp. 3-52]|nr:hypothetical protein [Microvirga sp. 3-52]
MSTVAFHTLGCAVVNLNMIASETFGNKGLEAWQKPLKINILSGFFIVIIERHSRLNYFQN